MYPCGLVVSFTLGCPLLFFHALLTLLLLTLAGYAAVVISDHGIGLFPLFFGDMAAMTWPGQFNLDFMLMLLLSALWVSCGTSSRRRGWSRWVRSPLLAEHGF